MKGHLTRPFAMHVCAPFWPSPWRQWPYCLKRAGARDSPTGLLSQMTVQVSEVQPLLTHRVQDWPGTCHCHFHALDTWSLLHLCLYDHRYHSPLNRNHTSSLSCFQEQRFPSTQTHIWASLLHGLKGRPVATWSMHMKVLPMTVTSPWGTKPEGRFAACHVILGSQMCIF